MRAVPRRFRRRLLWSLLLGSLVPALAVGALGAQVLDQVLALSLSPVESVLDEADDSLRRAGQPDTGALRDARLLVAQAELARESLRRLTVGWFLGLVLVAAVGAATAALLLGRAFARPVASLSEAMAQVAQGNLQARVPPLPHPESDELAFVVQQFNQMTGQLVEQRDRLEVTQRLAAWQEVARSMAHELKNPLTAMKMALGRLARVDLQAPDPVRMTESVSLLEDQVDALMRMTHSFSEFARLPAAAPVELPLRALVSEVAHLYAAQRPDCAVELSPGSEVRARVDGDLLRRAVSNLIKNALEASPPGAGSVEVAVAQQDQTVTISVRDHGVGMDRPLALGRSDKPGGSGLGLPITQKIIHEHGGTLALVPAEGGGTRAVIRLPGAAS